MHYVHHITTCTTPLCALHHYVHYITTGTCQFSCKTIIFIYLTTSDRQIRVFCCNFVVICLLLGTRYGTEYPCPAGTYRTATGAQAVADCQACPGGYFCDEQGQTDYTKSCTAGYLYYSYPTVILLVTAVMYCKILLRCLAINH